jgi:putative ABC transport system permease protein
MRSFMKFRLRLRTLLKRDAVEHELSEELRFHLEQQVAENLAVGMSAEDARVAAFRTVGGMAQIAEDCRDARGMALLESLAQDFKYGLRQLRRAPGFTAVAVLTLALGIGANVAIFTVINALMLKSLPVEHPEQLVEVNQGSDDHDALTYPMFRQVVQQQDVFSGVCASTLSEADLATGGARQLIFGVLVSGEYFSTIGVHAILGRTISNQDDERGSENVALISFRLWQNQFASDPQVIGRKISLNKKTLVIVGVMPRGFFGTEIGQQVDFALPLHALQVLEPSSSDVFENRQNYWLGVMARLKPGVTLEQARARLRTLAPSINFAVLPPKLERHDRDEFLKTPLDATPAGRSSIMRYQYGRSVILLAGMVGVVLLIACANVANLLLAKATAREHEYAVRSALGARRGRVVRQVLTESLMLSAGGVVAGMFVARWGSEWLVRATGGPRFPAYLDLSPDFRVLAFVVAVAVATAILFGLAPALRLSDAAPISALKHGLRGTAGGRTSKAVRWLTAVQIALCLVLLFSAELLVRSIRELLNQDLGFRQAGVLLIQTDIGDRPASPQRDILGGEFLRSLQALPGVRSASRSVITPMGGASIQWRLWPDAAVNANPSESFFNVASPGYFSTLGIPLIAGRDFDERDTPSSPRVAILDQLAARKLYPNQNPLGRTYGTKAFTRDREEITVTIIGLVGNTKYRRLRDLPSPTVYVPISQVSMFGPGRYEVRFSSSASAMTKSIEAAAQALDPTISLDISLFSSQIRDSLHHERLMAQLSSIFSTLALVLAVIGVYGVFAYAVAGRTNELGIRVALGARRADITSMIIREAMLVSGIGIALGAPVALLTSRLVRTLLFGVGPGNALTMVLAIAVIILAALLASYLPARRAARVDPMVALRYE